MISPLHAMAVILFGTVLQSLPFKAAHPSTHPQNYFFIP